MGIVIRQSIQNTVLSYTGAALGMVNVMFLMPRLMADKQAGFIQLTNSVAMMLSILMLVGMNSTLVRYYPRFKRQRRLSALFRFCAWVFAGVALVVALGYWLAWPLAQYKLAQKSPLFLSHYGIALAIGSVLGLVTLLESLLQSNLNTSVAILLREVCLRLGVTLLLCVYYWQWISFEVFVYGYMGLHVLLLISILLKSRKYLLLQRAEQPLRPKERKGLLRYSLYSLASTGSIILVFELDKIMVGSMIGEEVVAYYSLYIAMATAIAIPSKSFLRIGLPLVAQAWQRMDMAYLKRIYTQSSLVNSTICGLLVLLVLANRDALLGHLLKPSYAAYFSLFYILVTSIWLNVAFGINHYLLNTSKKFVYELYNNLLLLVLAAAANYLLIPLWGLYGAAIATLFSMLFTNVLKSVWLYRFYGLQPFEVAHLKVLLAMALCGAIAWWLPGIHWVADLFWKSALLTVLFLGLAYRLHISEDLNGFISRFLPSFLRRRAR